MGDPDKFSNLIIFWIFNCLFIVLLLSEIILAVVTFIRGYKSKVKHNDRGSMILLIIGFCLCLYLSFFFRSQTFKDTIGNILLPDVFSYIGLVFILGGLIIRWVSIASLNKAFTYSVKTAKDQHLVTTGMYKYLRNPAYSGSILSLLGVALAYRNVISIAAVIIISLLCYSYRIHIEEKSLADNFGDEFKAYCSHTKRLIPFIL